MSANDHTTAHEEDHSGPIKTPQQLLAAIFFSFVIPIFGIIALVYYVTSDNRPAAGAVNLEKAVAQRIQKIGMVEIRDANRPLKAGAEVYAAQCAACHTTGVAGAPKFGDAGAWGPRIKTGFEALLNSALKGKGAMGPQGGGDFEDAEIGRAVAHMGNAAGAKFAEPQRAAAVATAPQGAAPAAAPSADVVAALAAANKIAAAPVAAAATGAVPALYTQACAACHVAGVANAPKLGDKAAWAPRVAMGVDALTASVIKGKGAMPPRGGSTGSDADIKAVVQYMVSSVK
ncbi:c-type cytochrome [Polaromonas eurypsychrophila]|uniref:Cytochrome c n=1 Tax=Polaromonas eurypsychrophila TaxID=1614635 RepID=A0A916SNL6_9BURK|nr:c-type cytochrome [Polaromonas eurypsychrophila]GGB09746.1 cytochrome c [Polaromonas eurypsychrophila]